MKVLRLLGNSQLFISLCALLLCAETYLIATIAPSFIVLSVVFFSTLFVYNASRLSLSFLQPRQKHRWQLTIDGSKYHVILCVFSFIGTFFCLTNCNHFQVAVFLIGALLSIAYLMPFSKNGVRTKGLRNNVFLKNITLSLIWALITVWFPFAGADFPLGIEELVFIFIRHFLFIYALTVVYDLRDLNADSTMGMKTLAMKLGESGSRIFAVVVLLMFVLFVVLDPTLHTINMKPVSLALYTSAVISAIIVASVNLKKSKYYYLYVVDGAMIIQYFLVLIFTGIFN